MCSFFDIDRGHPDNTQALFDAFCCKDVIWILNLSCFQRSCARQFLSWNGKFPMRLCWLLICLHMCKVIITIMLITTFCKEPYFKSNEKANKKAENNYLTACPCQKCLEAIYQKKTYSLFQAVKHFFLLPSLSAVSQPYIDSWISKAERKKNKHYLTMYCYIVAVAVVAPSQNGPELCSWSGTCATLSPQSRCWRALLCISFSWWKEKVHASAVVHVVLFENYECERGNNRDKTNCTQKITQRSKNEVSV